MIKKRNNKIIHKILTINIIIIILLMNFNFVYGNLDDNEKIDIEKIKTETIPTVKNTNSEPSLNSRIGLIYDRSSGRILYEKNGNKQTPMASTTNIMTS